MREQDHDVVHTLDLSGGNQTADATLIEIADRPRTRTSWIRSISTANRRSCCWWRLRNLCVIVTAFETADFIEINRTGVMVRG